MDDITNTPVIDLRAVAEQKAEQKRQEEQKKNSIQTRVDNSRVYEISLKEGPNDTFQVAGTLMLTGAFFAVGTPLIDGSGVDFEFAAPIEQVNYVIAIDEDDLTEDAAS